MGGEIIAEKFALLKTRGGNGVSFTHIVEDTLLGRRAVVKVSDKLEELGLEYHKTMNLAGESGIPGLLVPFEGGFLEEEAGYYLAFPEVGEPSLENYLRMGAPISSGDVLAMARKILVILESLHAAGLCHLFIDTRNVFYRPRGEVTLKDPALRREYFHSFLDLVDAPDFSYLSPGVMDGSPPGCGSDLYALGRLIERCLERAADAAVSPDAEAARWLAQRCRSAGSGDDGSSAAELARELEERLMDAEKEVGAHAEGACRGASRRGAEADGYLSQQDRRTARRGLEGRRGGARALLLLSLLLVLACGTAAVYFLAIDEDRAPAQSRGGGSLAGEELAHYGLLEAKGKAAAQSGDGGTDRAEAQLASGVQSAVYESDPTGRPAGVETPAAELESPPLDAPSAAPSPASPVASFTLSPGEGQAPLQVLLDASASYDPDGHIVSYAWSCGGSGKSLYRVFESNIIPAVIPVTLTVTDDGGHSAHITMYVTLY